MMQQIARVAVDVSVRAADRLYDYRIPAAMTVAPGCRVVVPFGRGNRSTEAMVLKMEPEPVAEKRVLKEVEQVLDETPLLSDALLQLTVYLRRRLGCTYYSILHAMLPSGVWFRGENCYERTDVPFLPADAVQEQLLSAIADGINRETELLKRCKCSAAVLDRLCRAGILLRRTEFHPSAGAKTALLYERCPELPEESSSRRNRTGAAAGKVLSFLQPGVLSSGKEITYYTGVSESTVRSMVKRGLLRTVPMEIFRRPIPEKIPPRREIALNEAQRTALAGICQGIDAGQGSAALLFGVTGSGKTEVYIQAIRHTLETGRSAMLLVPEIALTPAVTARFYAEFGDTVAVLHSGLSVGERYDEWRRIRTGAARVVVGARSAVFAPLEHPGLIIIDEEHEPGYRSESDPRYDAREVAKFRCHKQGALLLLGSATPSIETAYYAQTGVYCQYRLPARYGAAVLPSVIVSDMRLARRQGYGASLGPDLLEKLDDCVRRGEQAILFINRRGSCRSLHCMACGSVIHCTRCSVPMSYHSENGRLICHSCGLSRPADRVCPECGSAHLEEVGAGTQHVQQELQSRFPSLRIIRMDSDTTAGKHGPGELLRQFAAQEADVLLGTQMVAKGLNFPNVTLSAVIDADMSLYTADFEGAARTFSQITQVAGRAGRGDKPGFAVIQTSAPENSVVQAAAAQDYWRFYEEEIRYRQSLNLPPMCRMVIFTVSAPADGQAAQAAAQLRRFLDRCSCETPVAVLGPAPAVVHKLNNRWRYTVTLRGAESPALRTLVDAALTAVDQDRTLRDCRVSIERF